MPRRARSTLATVLLLGAALAGCRVEESGDAPVATQAQAAADTSLAASDAAATTPVEIYFDLTEYAWYREGRPLQHDGRPYQPQSDPTPADRELREAGSYEGVTYYAAADAAEPVYTLYVPVYYGYWQRFTSPPAR